LLPGDGLAALPADLLVELVAALAGDGLPALAADLLVEAVATLGGDLLATLAARLLHRHSALLLLIRHCNPPSSEAKAEGGRRRFNERPPAPRYFFLPSSISSRTRCPPLWPISE